MRTTLDVDPDLLAEAEKLTGEMSPSKTVDIALRELVRRWKLHQLKKLMGSGALIDNWRELEALELEEMRKQQLG